MFIVQLAFIANEILVLILRSANPALRYICIDGGLFVGFISIQLNVTLIINLFYYINEMIYFISLLET